MSTKPECVAHFIHYFENIHSTSLDDLDTFYTPEIVFEDPIHRLEGLARVKDHFEKLNGNLGMGRFYFLEEDHLPSKSYLRWIMDVRLKKPKSRIRVEGLSVLYHDQLIHQQKDFFDLGAMVYENVPLLGRFVRSIKKKM